MRFQLPTTLLALAALAPFVTAQAAPQAETPDTTVAAAASIQTSPAVSAKDDEATTFNGEQVPAMKEIGGKDLAALISQGYSIVKFYSPQCGHCIHIAPLWQTLYEFYWTSKPLAATTTGDQQGMNDFHHFYGGFDFANVDCIAFGDTCTEFKIESYPTFILFKEGEIVKRQSGLGTMEKLSGFVEAGLEIIRPGSRTQGGPKLPEAGAKMAPDFDMEAFKAGQKDAASKTKPTGVPKKQKPLKPVSTPNPAGSSISLTAESFQKLVTMSQEPWFIKFYAPWCKHCQAMAPVWNQLGKEMRGQLHVGEVNCEAETRLCKDVRIRGYPSILFFQGGERVEYTGLRGLGDFVSYANNAIEIGSGVKDVDFVEFKEMEEKEEVIFVYFYDHATTSEDFVALERLTLSLIGHAKLVKTNSAKLAERYKITTWPRLLVSRDGRPTYYTALAPKDMRDFRQVLNWMQSVWLPLVPELTASNARSIMDGKLVVLGILSRARADEFKIAKKELKSAAIEWMDKQTQNFQRERQELRDAKQLKLEEAEDRNDQRALRNAKLIRINMDQSEQKEVGFAWVDGVFWERWLQTTFGIKVKDGEKVIINDEDNKQYWDETANGNPIMASRTSILETIPKVVSSPPKIKPKLTIGTLAKFFLDIRNSTSEHPWLTFGLVVAAIFGGAYWSRGRMHKSRGGFFRLDEKDGLLGHGNGNGKVD